MGMAQDSSYAAMRDAAARDPERFWREAADLVGWFQSLSRGEKGIMVLERPFLASSPSVG